MSSSHKLRPARNLRFRIDADGSLRASVSASAGEFVLGPEVLALVQLMAGGRALAPSETLAALRKHLRECLDSLPDEDELEALVHDLVEAGVLLQGQGQRTGLEDGFGDPWIQWAMVGDTVRNAAYAKAIETMVAQDSVVLDVGAGTGLLSGLALASGARRVHAIEETAVGRQLAGVVAEALGDVKGRLKLHQAHSRDVEIPADVTLVVSELFGNDPFQEGVIPTLADIGARLRKAAAFVPQAVDVYAELCNLRHPRLGPRVQRWQAPPQRRSTPLEALVGAVARKLDFSTVSFPFLLQAKEIERISKPCLLKSVRLDPPRAEPWEGKKELRCDGEPAIPVLLLWFRVKLVPGATISSHPAEKDACEHWSPIVIPLRKPGGPLKSGQTLELRYALSDELNHLGMEVFAGRERLGGR